MMNQFKGKYKCSECEYGDTEKECEECSLCENGSFFKSNAEIKVIVGGKGE